MAIQMMLKIPCRVMIKEMGLAYLFGSQLVAFCWLFLESAVTGVHVSSSISLQFLTLIAIIYVDDTDILLTDATRYDMLEKVFIRAQKAAKVWQQAVYVFGRAVCPDKCCWTAFGFCFESMKMVVNESD